MLSELDATAHQSFSAEPASMPAQERFDESDASDRELGYLRQSLIRTAVAVGMASVALGPPLESDTAWAAAELSHSAQAHESSPAVIRDRRSILSSEVKAYRGLTDDWDGEGGVAPSSSAIDDALAFIELLPLRARLPRPMVSGDGEVGFYWKTEDCYIDVGFFGNGTISYYGRSEQAGIEAKGSQSFNRRALPKDLIDVINSA